MLKYGRGRVDKVWAHSVSSPFPLKYIPFNDKFKVFFSIRGEETGIVTVGVFIDDKLEKLMTTTINKVNESKPVWFEFPHDKEIGKHTIQFKIGTATGTNLDSVIWNYSSPIYEVEVR